MVSNIQADSFDVRLQNTEYSKQEIEHMIQKTWYRTNDTEHRYMIQKTWYRIQKAGNRTHDTEHKIQNTRYKTQGTEHKIQNTGTE